MRSSHFLSGELPADLAFMAPFLARAGKRYQLARWLKCDFSEAVWYVVSLHPFQIDWRVRVGAAGQLLTDPAHASLLEAFKSWVIVQSHIDVTGGRFQSKDTEYKRIRRTLHCIDYLLLNADRLGLAEHGLLALSSNDFSVMLSEIASDGSTSVGVYGWPARLSVWLRERGQALAESELTDALRRSPFLSKDIVSPEDRITDLSEAEIVRARAWLWTHGHYPDTVRISHGFTRIPARIAAQIYPNTLVGKSNPHPRVPELGLFPGHKVETEYPRVPVTTARHGGMTRHVVNRYIQILSSLRLLASEGLQTNAPQEVDLVSLANALELKQPGRYRTPSVSVVFGGFRKATEFALEFGSAILQSYTSLAIAAHREKLSIPNYVRIHDISPHLHSDAKRLGVTRWTIDAFYGGAPRVNRAIAVLTAEQYYGELRRNVGLWECICVLFGAIQFIVGALMARRQGELQDLIAGKCFDESKTLLRFANRKSGALGLREIEVRPIPSLGVELLDLLESMQARLIEAGALECHQPVFACPPSRGTDRSLASVDGYTMCLDMFCDWAETDCDELGRRHYIRQHQLRRFFCMLFFWGNSFGGLETLRYFLGQTDAAHLYNYITESTPGAVLRGAAADWARYGVEHGSAETAALAQELFEHFGTRSFEVLESDVLQDYIEDLLESGRLKIEPQFLDDGRNYRIAVQLVPEGVDA